MIPSEYIRDNKYGLWAIFQEPDAGYRAVSESYYGGQISTTAKTRDELFDRIDISIRGRGRILSRDDTMPVVVASTVVAGLGALAVPALRSPIGVGGMALAGLLLSAAGMSRVKGGMVWTPTVRMPFMFNMG